eukprot:gene26216-5974_t
MFGFLALCFVTVVIATCEVTVVLVYFLLVFEDHRWWWRSVIIPGGMGMHFFLYSIYYFQTQLKIQTGIATFIYFLFGAAVSVTLCIAVGTIGWVSAWFFIRSIYSNIKPGWGGRSPSARSRVGGTGAKARAPVPGRPGGVHPGEASLPFGDGVPPPVGAPWPPAKGGPIGASAGDGARCIRVTDA